MTDTSMTPEVPDAAEVAHFLRRFADLMSVGHNATYLTHAADMLDTLAVRVTAAQDEEQLWRYKYETVTHHADLLEAECETLKHDIDGHLAIITSTLAERNALAATVEAQKSELSELQQELDRERERLHVQTATHDGILAGLRGAFDGEYERLQAAIEKGAEELAELRLAFEREREGLKAQFKVREAELSELCLASDRQRVDLQAQLKASTDELAAFHIVAGRERDAQIAKIAALEAKQAEIRSAFDRINELRNQTNGHQDGAERAFALMAGLGTERSPPAHPGEAHSAVRDTDAVVPKATLRQARAQFEYLASEFTGAGDVASQVMCELGAFTMDMALGSGRKTGYVPVGEVALSILAAPSVTPQAPDVLTSVSNSSP